MQHEPPRRILFVSVGAKPGTLALMDALAECLSRQDYRIESFRADSQAAPEDSLQGIDEAFSRLRPDSLVISGDVPILGSIAKRARSGGVGTAILLDRIRYTEIGMFAEADAAIALTEAAARFHRASLGIRCTTMPPIADWSQAHAASVDPAYVTFVDPLPEHGAYVFARIADELGRRRPDIPILVVEGGGTEATLVGCGLDLRAHGNVQVMSQPGNSREFWGLTRLAVVPSLAWEVADLIAMGAAINGIPVIASDRGSAAEMLGGAATLLPLPHRITAATRFLPTPEEVAPWVEAIITIWDDGRLRSDLSRSALAKAEGWRTETSESAWIELLAGLRAGPGVLDGAREERSRWAVLVPFLHTIEHECEEGLRRMERAGVNVVRCRGSSAIDLARNTLSSEALRRACEAILFIDADIEFDHLDALRLLARPEPVVAGVYPKKRAQELASSFLPEVREVTFGPDVAGLYPLEHAAGGFLRIRTDVLRRIIAELDLPLCNAEWEAGFWPFFLPAVVPRGSGHYHYLTEDWAFSDRLRRIGLTPMADTTIRLSHIGAYGFTWEDAGTLPTRFRDYTYRFSGPKPAPALET